jgi:predicted phage-related endonuclease
MPDPDHQTISASQAAALWNISPWVSRFMLWHNFKDGTDIDPGESEPMRWGKLLEPTILAETARRMSLEITPHQPQIYERHATYPLGCTKDATVIDPSRGLGIVEAKNVSSWGYNLGWTATAVPEHVDIQLQTQMLVCGAEFGVVAALVDGHRLHLYERQPEPAFHRELIDAAAMFLASVETGTPPPASGVVPEATILANKYRTEPGKILELNGDAAVAKLLKDFHWHRGQSSMHQKLVTKLKTQVLELAADAEMIIADGVSAKISRAELPAGTVERAAYTRVNINTKLRMELAENDFGN